MTAEPFGPRLRRLREERGLSLETFAYQTRDHGGLTFSAVGQFERGVTYPRQETIEILAKTLEMEPAEFPEWRLAEARRRLDEREVGLDEALAELERIAASSAPA